MNGRHGCGHHRDHGSRADRREESERQENAATKLEQPRGPCVDVSGLQADPFEETGGSAQPVAAERAKQLLRAVADKQQADH